MMNTSKIIAYFLCTSIAVVVTWLLHEFAHWQCSEWLGYNAIMRFNGTELQGTISPTNSHKFAILASGPLITVIQALILYFLLNNKWNRNLYPFLFVPFYMRLFAGAMNLFNLNDEGKMGKILGIGVYTFPLLIVMLLLFLIFKISKKYHLDWKLQMFTYFIVMIISSIIILGDQFFQWALIS